ncbi:MAG: hypothetical protein Q9200_007820, partial [Gallowayella weberi]
MKTPHLFTCGIPALAALYKSELRRRQPHGPYYLGGWSAGGVVAYEICTQLIDEGESIARLVLLDCPCPVRLETLPARLHVFLDRIGLLGPGGAGSAPSWLLPHFEAEIRALDGYSPRRIREEDQGRAPRKTFAVWATEGVCADVVERERLIPVMGDETRSMRWLLEDRGEFGANGWDELIPGGESRMEFATVKANHFTMMRKPV